MIQTAEEYCYEQKACELWTLPVARFWHYIGISIQAGIGTRTPRRINRPDTRNNAYGELYMPKSVASKKNGVFSWKPQYCPLVSTINEE